MICLALDTTTDVCSLALADEGGLIAEYDFLHHMDLSRRLMPNIVSLLQDSGLRMNDVEAVAVSVGPGSFTGLRIGVVTAKVIARTRKIPLAGVVTLDLLAWQFTCLDNSVVCPVIRVRKGEVYYAFFRMDGKLAVRLTDYIADSVEKLVTHTQAFSAPQIFFVGDGLSEALTPLKNSLGNSVVTAPAWLSYAKASILANIGIQRISNGLADNPLTLVPFYIRRPAAEIRAEEISTNH